MSRDSTVRVAAFAILVIASISCRADEAKWKLVWSDEFDGAEIDKSKWDFDLGNGFYTKDPRIWIGGWGNDELQYYTKDPENSFVKNGSLHIRAIKKNVEGFKYTSARLKSKKADGGELFAKKYGKFEFRAKLPTGRGVWPALWMLPQDDKYGGWPRSGEIDVMEARGQESNKVLGTLHYGPPSPNNIHTGKDYILPNGGTIADFHIYTLEWEPGVIRWSFDGKTYQSQSSWWSPKSSGRKNAKPQAKGSEQPWPAPFDQPFFLVMNIAVGGRFLGNPDESTAFPVEMLVDYVRVYDKVGGYGTVHPKGKGNLSDGR